jgi:hypothetical protein
MRNQSTMSLFKLVPLFQKAYLITSDNFYQPVNKLSPTLTHVITRHYSNQTVTVHLVDSCFIHSLPHTIKYLDMSTLWKFNQPVDKLPPILTHLTTGFCFNQPVDKLPPTLTHLTTGAEFNHPVNKPFEIREPT